jgi:hypothetical protein
MTHDELLKEIDRYLVPTLAESEVGNKAIGMLKALHAVIELHTPIENNEHLCSACWFGDGMMSYPCLTIQSIEKELGSATI